MRGVGDDGLERDEDCGLGNTRAEAADRGVVSEGVWVMEEGDIPRENVERLPDVGVAVPAEHQQEVAEGREGDGEDDEGLVAAGSGGMSTYAPHLYSPTATGHAPLDENA